MTVHEALGAQASEDGVQDRQAQEEVSHRPRKEEPMHPNYIGMAIGAIVLIILIIVLFKLLAIAL